MRPDPLVPDWHEPPHIRDQRSARERLASQIASGADVIVAPTWLTHRRALLPVGETRQARAWTAAAVRLAHEAVEAGLERRAEAEVPTSEPGDRQAAQDRPVPLVAAVLPALDLDTDAGSGRLLPREAAGERDYHDQVGLLTDAQPDLLLLEGQTTLAALRLALDPATANGLPAWVVLSDALTTQASLGATLEVLREAGVAMTLLAVPAAPAVAERLPGRLSGSGLPWGAHLSHPTEGAGELASDWLGAGASVIALLDGATPTGLEALRRAVDSWERSGLEARRRAEERWWRVIRQAAVMAPGGMAVWLAEAHPQAGPESRLPGGFEWLVVHPADAERLPDARFRLLVDGSASSDAIERAARLLERGGVAALRAAGAGLGRADLRIVVLDEAERPPLAILRRDD